MRTPVALAAGCLTAILSTAGLDTQAQAGHGPAELAYRLHHAANSAHRLAHSQAHLGASYRRLDNESDELVAHTHHLLDEIRRGHHRHIDREIRAIERLTTRMLERVDFLLADGRRHRVYHAPYVPSAGTNIRFRFGRITIGHSAFGGYPGRHTSALHVDPRQRTLERIHRELDAVHHAVHALDAEIHRHHH